jgi:hypothetical protein
MRAPASIGEHVLMLVCMHVSRSNSGVCVETLSSICAYVYVCMYLGAMAELV